MTAPSAESRRDVVRRLSAAQKSNRGAAGYSRWVNRPAGRQIAAWAYRAGLTPNQVTGISALFTFASLTAIATVRPTWPVAVLIVLGLLIGYAFDSADGQVARLRGGGSPAGEWLDHIVDAVKMSVFHLLIAISWYRFYDHRGASLLIPLSFCVVSMVFFFALLLSDMLRRVDDAKSGGQGAGTSVVDPTEAAPVLRSLIVLPNDYGVLCLCLLLRPAHSVFVVVYTVLLVANAVFLVAGSVRWYREMNRLGRSARPTVHPAA